MQKIFVGICFLLIVFTHSIAQDGKIVKLDFKSKALEANLTGESNIKSVFVYLPAGYDKTTDTKYPVMYLLHGFTGKAKDWFDFGGDSIVQVSHINQLIENRKVKPFIIVMPDAYTLYGGGFYTNSITTGNWEDYIEEDIVALIDSKFRTIKNKDSRGIAGHSMGGYGALKIAMKHPDVFSTVYASSACCLGITDIDNDYSEKDIQEALSAKSWDDFNKLEFFSRAIIASAAAWSPNPTKPPFYADLPFGNYQTDSTINIAKNKMAANVPMWMIDQNITNFKKLRSISFDVGSKELSIKQYNIQFSNLLNQNHIPHQFTFFNGGHVDMLKNQFENFILPYFSKWLKF